MDSKHLAKTAWLSLAVLVSYSSACRKQSNSKPPSLSKDEHEDSVIDTSSGALALDLGGAVGLGFGTQTAADGSTRTGVLFRLDADGSIQTGALAVNGAGLVGESSVLDFEVKQLFPAGDAGTLLHAIKQGHSEEPAFESGDLALIQGNGAIIPLSILGRESSFRTKVSQPNVAYHTQLTGSDTAWALENNQKSIHKFSLSSATGSPFVSLADSDATINAFGVTEQGHLIYGKGLGPDEKTIWVRPDGTSKELSRFRYPASNIAPLGSGVGIFSNIFVTPSGNDLELLRLGMVYLSSSSTGWNGPTSNSGAWVVSPIHAIRFNLLNVAGNPFIWSPGTQNPDQASNQIMLDDTRRLAFDGNNVVQLGLDSSNRIKVDHFQNIYVSASQNQVVAALFGENQGFVGKWAAIIVEAISPSERKYFFGEVNQTTGRFVDGSVYEFDPPNGETELDLAWFTASIYRIGGKTLFLSSHIDIGLRELNFNSATRKVHFGTDKGINSYLHNSAIVNGSKLYILKAPGTAEDSRKVFIYDATADSLTTPGSAIVPAGLSTGDFTVACAGSDHGTFVALVSRPGKTPSILSKRCGVSGDENLVLISYADTDFSFSTVESKISIPISEADADTTTTTLHKTVLPIRIGSQTIAIGANAPFKVVLVDLGGEGTVVSAASMLDAVFENRYDFAGYFDYPQMGSTYGVGWGDQFLLISGKVAGIYKSYRVDLTTRVRTLIPGLNGIKIEAGSMLSTGSLFVSGIQSSDNSPRQFMVSDELDVTAVETDIQVKQVVPLVADE